MNNIGNKYEDTKNLDIKEIAKMIRKDIKKALPNLKTSVKISRYSMGQSIDVEIKNADFNPINEQYVRDMYSADGEYLYNNDTTASRFSVIGETTLNAVNQIVQAYNYDNSDSMTDYFDVRFYGQVNYCSDFRQTQTQALLRAA